MRHPANTPPSPIPPPITAHGAFWADTQPLGFEPAGPAVESSPFREVLEGMEMRELVSDELFRLFFGKPR